MKIVKFLDADLGSGMEKIRIRDKKSRIRNTEKQPKKSCWNFLSPFDLIKLLVNKNSDWTDPDKCPNISANICTNQILVAQYRWRAFNFTGPLPVW